MQFQRNICSEIHIDPDIQARVLLWRLLHSSPTRRDASVPPRTQRWGLLLDQGLRTLARLLLWVIGPSIRLGLVLVLCLICVAGAVRTMQVYSCIESLT